MLKFHHCLLSHTVVPPKSDLDIQQTSLWSPPIEPGLYKVLRSGRSRGATTFSIKGLFATFSIKGLFATISTTTLSIKGLFATFSITTHSALRDYLRSSA
jgi:hypothetical protein